MPALSLPSPLMKFPFCGGYYKLDGTQNKGVKHCCPRGAYDLPQVIFAFCALFTMFLDG